MTGSADSIQTYREMLKLDPRSRVFALLAEKLCAAGEWEQVAQVCKEGLVYHPDHLRSRVLLGWALMEMGEADQSEHILLEAVEDIRNSAIIFKLLSEFAIFSGNPESAGEYARMYQAFEPPGADAQPPAEPDRCEPPTPIEKEAADWADLKTEAVEELQEPDLDVEGTRTTPTIRVEDILAQLPQRIDVRLNEMAWPDDILSPEDKNFLKQELIAALSAD